MNIALAVMLVVVGFAAVVWARLRTGDVAHPVAVIVAAWSTSLGLYLLRMLPYPALSGVAAAVLLLGVGSLLAGMLLAHPLARRSSPRIWPVAKPAAWVVTYSVLGLLGTAWYVWEVHRLMGWGALLHEADRIRVALGRYDIPSRFLFLQFFCMIAPLLAVGLTFGGYRLRAWHWGLAGLCVACTWITTDRTQFFTVVLASLFMCFLRWGRALSVPRLAGATTLAAAALVANFLGVGYWREASPENLGFALTAPRTARGVVASSGDRGRTASAWRLEAGVREPSASSPADTDEPVTRNKALATVFRKSSTLYLYATASYAAFGLWYPSGQPLIGGVHSIYPVARLLERVGLVSGSLPPAVLGFAKVARRGNTAIFFNGYTFLYYPVADFGVAGMAVYCLVIGLLVGTVYERTRRVRGSSLHLVSMGQISLALVLSIFVDKFNSTSSWYLLVATTVPFWGTALVSSFFRRRERVGPNAIGVEN